MFGDVADFFLSGLLRCSQKHLQVLPQDISHAHLLCIRVEFVQVLFRAGSVMLQSGKKCFRTYSASAADHISNCSLKVICRHFVSGRCTQYGPPMIEQLCFDIINLALVLDCCRYRVIGRNGDRLLKRSSVRNTMKKQGCFMGKDDLICASADRQQLILHIIRKNVLPLNNSMNLVFSAQCQQNRKTFEAK